MMSQRPLDVVLFGYGYWGRNLARNVMSHPGLELTRIVDPHVEKLEAARSLFASAECSTDAASVFREARCDIALLATPAETHHELAKKAMEAGMHVLVTKPLARTIAHAEELGMLAETNRRVLLMDHTFVYTGAVRKMSELIAAGELGDLVYCSSIRMNLGTYRRDVSVIWDLAPHDISILDAVGYAAPVAVAATAGGRLGGNLDQVASLSLFYADGFLAHFNVSWLAPVKLRLMLLGGTDKMLVYDDVDPSEKVKIYDKGVDLLPVGSADIQPAAEYRLGDMWAPRLDQTEALRTELDHLVECIRHDAAPLTGPDSGINCVITLDAAERSARMGGDVVVLDAEGWSRCVEMRERVAPGTVSSKR
jgi:predicted dehydrogenase